MMYSSFPLIVIVALYAVLNHSLLILVTKFMYSRPPGRRMVSNNNFHIFRQVIYLTGPNCKINKQKKGKIATAEFTFIKGVQKKPVLLKS